MSPGPREVPKTNLGIALVVVVSGGGAMLLMLSHGVIGYLVVLPWLVGAMGSTTPFAARRSARRRVRSARSATRALHFSVFSVSVTAIFVVIVLAKWFGSRDV